jgi:RND family efflux transporter MFP subunit
MMPWPLPDSRNSVRRLRILTIVAAIVLHPPVAAVGAETPSFDCVIDPSQTVRLGSPIPGLLSEVLVSRGDMIRAGQVVARLESTVEAATVKYNRLRAQSTARIDAQAARLELSRARMGRANELLTKNVVSRDKHDEQQADLFIAQQELAREKADRQLAQLEIERSEAVLEQRTIRSPFAGVVSERKLSGGEYINQEGHILSLSQLDPLHVEVFLPVAMYPQVALGMAGAILPDPPIGGSYAAKIIVIDRVFDPASSTFGVRLALPNPDNRLPAGQRCKVMFPHAAASGISR